MFSPNKKIWPVLMLKSCSGQEHLDYSITVHRLTGKEAKARKLMGFLTGKPRLLPNEKEDFLGGKTTTAIAGPLQKAMMIHPIHPIRPFCQDTSASTSPSWRLLGTQLHRGDGGARPVLKVGCCFFGSSKPVGWCWMLNLNFFQS